MPYETQNANNLVTLIKSSMKKSEGTIPYIAAGKFALLGAGHDPADVGRFNPQDCYKGTIGVDVKTKTSGTIKKNTTVTGLDFAIDGKLHKGGKVVKQMADRAQLEFAIRDALEGTDYSKATKRYNWA